MREKGGNAMFARIKVIIAVCFLSATLYSQYEGGFSTPAWDSSSRWEVTRNGGCDAVEMFLEGEARDALASSFGFSYTEAGTLGKGYLSAEGGRNFIGWYDVVSNRLHCIAGSGHGFLDGPFSRARFGLWHYTWHPAAAFSKDGRYMYMTDKSGSRHSLRQLDFEQQIVTTLIPSVNGTYRGLATGADGKIYLISSSCMLMVLSSNGQVEKTVQLDTANGPITGFTPHALPITIDDTNNRLYCNQSTRSWYVSYWDLSDLSFHGVVPKSVARRGRNAPGSFEGTDWYDEGSHISFGPDDPDKRFLYMARNDTHTMFRLDLQREWVSGVRLSGTSLSFVDTLPISNINLYASFRWIGNGSFLAGPRASSLYTRIQ
jgi:hypothetical protein